MIKGEKHIITLITEETTYNNIGVAVMQETESKAYAKMKSIGAKEYWNGAGQHDIKPEAVADIFTYDYHGEKLAEVDGERYQIYRTYIQGDTISLYLAHRMKEEK